MGMVALLERMYFLARYIPRSDRGTALGIILMDLGIPTGRVGFQFLKMAICMFYEDPNQLYTCQLYPDVARTSGAEFTKQQVEIAIRREIKRSWEQRDPEKWEIYFPGGITQRKNGPSNAEFISALAQLLELWDRCCERKIQIEREAIENGTEKSQL